MAGTSPFPEPIRIDFSAEAWRRVGRFAKQDFEALTRFLEDLAQRLTIAAIDSRHRHLRFESEGGPAGTCELDAGQRRLVVLTIEPALTRA